MTSFNDKDKKGFSGLSDLVSEVNDVDESIKLEPKADTKPSTPRQPIQPQQETKPHEAEQTTTNSPSSVETVTSGNKGSGSEGKWFIGIIGVIFFIWLINSGDNNKNPPSYTPQPSYGPQPSSQSYSSPKTNSVPMTQSSSTPQSTGLRYTKPSVGTYNVLTVPEIRWCIREGIRIESMRNIINSNAGVDAFNRIVNDYNSRCGNYRYRPGSQSQAEHDVEPYRSQIVSEAIREARQFGGGHQPSYSSASPKVSTDTTPKEPNSRYTGEAQYLLTALGYDPGIIDYDYGRRTADAVKAFQRDMGITQDGWIDVDLLNMLRKEEELRKLK